MKPNHDLLPPTHVHAEVIDDEPSRGPQAPHHGQPRVVVRTFQGKGAMAAIPAAILLAMMVLVLMTMFAVVATIGSAARAALGYGGKRGEVRGRGGAGCDQQLR